MKPERTPALPRLDSLTGLRFLAALFVFGHHAVSSQWSSSLGSIDRLLAPGSVGVSFFFLLSGFVLVWSHRPGDSRGRFYRRRAARILPAYYFVWPLALVVAWWEDFLPTPATAVLNLALVQSWVPREPVFFSLNSVTWSLSCEAFFYLCFPLMITALLEMDTQRRQRLMAGLVLFVATLNIAGAIAIPPDGYDYERAGVLVWLQTACPLTRLPEFVLGALLAAEIRGGRRYDVGVPVAWMLVAVAYLGDAYVGGWVSGQWPTLVPFLLLLAAYCARDRQGQATLYSRRALIRLGEWSFAFYLLHQLGIRVIHDLGFVPTDHGTSLAFAASALLTSLAASAGVYTFVERPAERRLRGPRTPRAQVEALHVA